MVVSIGLWAKKYRHSVRNIAMVLVAALALGSSTFAWFANNNKVTADGMTISAQAEGSQLIIADTVANLYSGGNANKTSVSLTYTGANLHPVHPVYTDVGASGSALVPTGASASWKHAFSDKYEQSITNKSNEEAVGEVTVDSNVGYVSKGLVNTNYFMTGTVAIGLTENSAEAKSNLRVTGVTFAWADGTANEDKKDLLKAARVMITDSDNKVLGVYGNGVYLTEVGDAQVSTPGAGDYVMAVKDTMGGTISNTTPVLAASLGKGSSNAKLYNLYVYFDGRDDNCTSRDFSSANLNLSLEFSIDQ